jgi:hypothetical protein
MATVLIVAERFLPENDGLAQATARIAQAAKLRGERVVVARLGAGVGSAEIDGITVRTVAADLASFAAGLNALVAEVGVDLVHSVWLGPAGYAGGVVACSHGLPHVASICGEELEQGLFQMPDAAFIAETVRGATVVTAFSEDLARQTMRLFRRPVEHVESPLGQAAGPVAQLESALYGALYCRARSEPLTRRVL